MELAKLRQRRASLEMLRRAGGGSPGAVAAIAVSGEDNDDALPVALMVVNAVAGPCLGFCEQFGGDGGKSLASGIVVPDTG